jgi:hypothetical protein
MVQLVAGCHAVSKDNSTGFFPCIYCITKSDFEKKKSIMLQNTPKHKAIMSTEQF